MRGNDTTAVRQLLVTTVPFGTIDAAPLRALEQAGIDYVVNPLGRKLKPDEAAEMIRGFRAVVAGTEPLDRAALDRAPHLRLIARVGVGLDNVDLLAARERGIAVSYTPEAPAAAVAELTIGLMLNALRWTGRADRHIRAGIWRREFGRRLSLATVGIVGMGRIGKRVIEHLAGFGPPRILAADSDFDHRFAARFGVEEVSLDRLWREADVISLHVPLSESTRDMVGDAELRAMRSDTVLINTARGGVVNEDALGRALTERVIAAAAVDVFVDEPYNGPLASVENCTLTAHMGSMSNDCRARMEIEAVEDVIRFFRGESLRQPVPAEEYRLREPG
jgi:D-3-phosphoglycerate dehydrogenase